MKEVLITISDEIFELAVIGLRKFNPKNKNDETLLGESIASMFISKLIQKVSLDASIQAKEAKINELKDNPPVTVIVREVDNFFGGDNEVPSGG